MRPTHLTTLSSQHTHTYVPGKQAKEACVICDRNSNIQCTIYISYMYTYMLMHIWSGDALAEPASALCGWKGVLSLSPSLVRSAWTLRLLEHGVIAAAIATWWADSRPPAQSRRSGGPSALPGLVTLAAGLRMCMHACNVSEEPSGPPLCTPDRTLEHCLDAGRKSGCRAPGRLPRPLLATATQGKAARRQWACWRCNCMHAGVGFPRLAMLLCVTFGQ